MHPSTEPSRARDAEPLLGLVLCGGASRRMGRDKGSLRFGGEAQARRAWRLLADLCGVAFVSIDSARASMPPYSELPTIVDEGRHRGPIAGLEAAWRHSPLAAWLVLAVDMPLVGRPVLERLLNARDRDAFATAFRHEDGMPEPLCTIWEPRARGPLLEQLRLGDASLRRFLERVGFAAVPGGVPAELRSVDDPETWASVTRERGETF